MEASKFSVPSSSATQKKDHIEKHSKSALIVNMLSYETNSKVRLSMFLVCLILFLIQLMISNQVSSSELDGQNWNIHQNRRVKRSLYELPDGADLLLNNKPLRSTFSCEGLGYGYYADPDNDCRIFHVCQSYKMSDGSIFNNHWSFICGNQTVFNQVTLSCTHPEDAVPCENAKDFYHVNDYFGDVRAPSVKQNDLDQASDLVSKAYGSRISSSQRDSY